MNISKNQSLTDDYWLEEYIDGFLDSLAKQGYSRWTIKEYRCNSFRLCRHAEALGIGRQDLDAGLFSELAGTCPGTGTRYMESQLSRTACRLTDYLGDKGVIPQPLPNHQVDDPNEDLIEELVLWLKNNKGLVERTIILSRNVFILFLNHFSEATDGVDDLASITPEMIAEFLGKHAGKNGWRVRYLRDVLRFLFWSGRISQDLSSSIPPIAGKRRTNLVRHVDSATVEKLLDALRGHTPMALRDYAVLLLMARLGLRAQEVIAMRLDDIDWSVGRVMIHGKGGDRSYMPLPIDVGDALVAWLRNGRRGISRHVFVSVKPPFGPLTSRMIKNVLRRAYDRTRLSPPNGEYRSHSLRHGLAMNLLEKGNSLAEISDVLRHNNMRTTTFYARHDLKSLRPLARSWPVEGGYVDINIREVSNDDHE